MSIDIVKSIECDPEKSQRVLLLNGIIINNKEDLNKFFKNAKKNLSISNIFMLISFIPFCISVIMMMSNNKDWYYQIDSDGNRSKNLFSSCCGTCVETSWYWYLIVLFIIRFLKFVIEIINIKTPIIESAYVRIVKIKDIQLLSNLPSSVIIKSNCKNDDKVFFMLIPVLQFVGFHSLFLPLTISESDCGISFPISSLVVGVTALGISAFFLMSIRISCCSCEVKKDSTDTCSSILTAVFVLMLPIAMYISQIGVSVPGFFGIPNSDDVSINIYRISHFISFNICVLLEILKYSFPLYVKDINI